MRSVSLLSLLAILVGLLSANASAADRVVVTEQTIRWAGGIVRVSTTHSSSTPATQDETIPDRVFYVNKLATYWVESPYGHSRIRITVPVRYYLTSWDVKALELELQRLGVKVKPKPAPPKPASYIAG